MRKPQWSLNKTFYMIPCIARWYVLKKMVHLIFRYLSNNKLSLVPLNGTFTGKHFSLTVDLSGNRIVALPPGVFQSLSVGGTL